MTIEGAVPGESIRISSGQPVAERLLFTLLYFAEGVPIGFLWWALPGVLREHGVDVASITTLTAALTVPWTLKFVAGPVIDRSVARGVGLRSWILACQVAMGAALLPLALYRDVPAYELLFALLLLHACCAALQDVAIDALCIRIVPPGRLGNVNGWMQFGMTTGRAAAAACVPLLIHGIGWPAAIVTIVALIWAPMLGVVLLVRAPLPATGAASASRPALAGLLSWSLVPAMGVALFAGCGFEASGALASPLLVDLGFDAAERAAFFGAIAPAGLALGGIAAAQAADRMGLRRAVGAGVLAVAVGVVAMSVAISRGAGGGMSGPFVLYGIVYCGAGFLISASYACFMRVARGPWGASRFSLLMALTNGCEAGSAFVVGRLAAPLGAGPALAAMAGLSLLSLPFLKRIDARDGREHGQH